MRRKIMYILLIAFISLTPLKTYGHNSPEFIDVRVDIKNINQEILLSSHEGLYLYHKNDLNSEILDISSKEIYIKVNNQDSMDIYDENNEFIDSFPGDGSILIRSQDRFNAIVQLDKGSFRGYITPLINNGNINIINHIDIEEYLYGVVPKEIPASSSHEALKAQAVVARSYAYIGINNHIKDGYNLCNTTHCQVYGGFDGEYPSTNQAVKDTYGDYVSYNGSVISTHYHSNSGGHTENSEEVWGGSFPYLTGVKDIYSNNSPNSSWTINVEPREIQNKFSSVGIDMGDILDIKIWETTTSNRVTKISIIGSKKEETMTGERFRSIMGNAYIKSTLFTVNKVGGENPNKIYVMDGKNSINKLDIKAISIIDNKGNQSINKSNYTIATGEDSSKTLDANPISKPSTFVLEGKGYGHGVGMSQYGAMEMARQGYNYNEIIKHYYQGVEIINLRK